MSVLFLNTSALIKRYLPERGSIWMRSHFQPDADHTIVISRVALVEAVAAFCRRARDPDPTQRITVEERDRLILLFRKNINKQHDIINVTTQLYTKAGDLCRFHQLRAYDAIQLSCALFASKRLVGLGRPAPIFVSADDRLLDIARAEGFNVENPNNYP